MAIKFDSNLRHHQRRSAEQSGCLPMARLQPHLGVERPGDEDGANGIANVKICKKLKAHLGVERAGDKDGVEGEDALRQQRRHHGAVGPQRAAVGAALVEHQRLQATDTQPFGIPSKPAKQVNGRLSQRTCPNITTAKCAASI